MTRLPALLVPLLLAATGVPAQETATTTPQAAPQEVSVTFTWSSVDAGPTMPMGEGQEAFIAEGLVVVASAEGPLAGLAGRCLLTGTTDLATFGGSAMGTCVYVDANGDQLWERIEESSEGNGAPMIGHGAFSGGTGRFEGATGEMDYETSLSGSPRPGVYQGTGVKRGTLVLPAS